MLAKKAPVPPMKRLIRRAKRGFQGDPIGTVSFYGPDDRRASKLVACVIEHEGEDASEMRKWYDDERDLRRASDVLIEVEAFFEEHQVVSVAVMERIIGCPHEEGIDYEGPTCPECPFWASRDRWTGETIQ